MDTNDNPLDCALVTAFAALSGKWKPSILRCLAERDHRFLELKRKNHPVKHKVLTEQLRQLERVQLVRREAFAEVPPKVVYSLTPKARSLLPLLDGLHRWSVQHLAG